MSRSRPKPKTTGNLPSESQRKSRNPKTPQEQVQAIADDVKAELIAYIYRYSLEQELVVEAVERALGIGGNSKIDDFISELESGFSKSVPSNKQAVEYTENKEDRPILKRVSTPTPVEVLLPKDSSKSTASNRPTPKPKK